MNSEFNGMPKWVLSHETDHVQKAFVGLGMTPGKIGATTPKYKEEEQKKEKTK